MNRFLAAVLGAIVSFLAVPTANAQMCTPPQVLLVVDKSSSMLGTLASGTTKWDAARTAINTMTTEFASNIHFGLQIFPAPNRCEPGEIVVDIAENTPEAIMDGLGMPPPRAGNWTPMSQTLDVAAGYAPLQDTERENVVVLITDGWQWCDPYSASTRFNVVTSVEALRALGVTVYVVGFGESVDVLALNRAAVAGGTARAGCDVTSSDAMAADNCYLAALDAVGLSAALSGIATETSAEICDGIDDDCDGRIDEDFDMDGDTFTTCGTDPDIPGFHNPDWLDCDDGDAEINPFASEICDGIDNDCNDEIDPGCDCTTGMERTCGTDEGICTTGTQTCTGGTWGDCDGNVEPIVEACNGVDEDCDGTSDEGATCMEGTCSMGACRDLTEPPVGPMDSDGDGLLDEIECPGGMNIDSDGDGMPDCMDPDDDNDGILTINERPSRADRDTDGDGIPDHLDPDDDNDGILTRDERPGDADRDTNGDGVPDHLEPDDDGDGILTRDERPGNMDRNTDGDDNPDHLDPDDDNDSIPTREERPGLQNQDTDLDGDPDHLDPDDDNDGIPTRQEANEDSTEGDDFDGDGTPSYLDTDADGDGILDVVEGALDADEDGQPDYLDVNDVVPGFAGGAGNGGCATSLSANGPGSAGFAAFMMLFIAWRRRR